ncbi:MAG: toll/interleukin-1 receptor domain-containing protein [Ginsengibacter sp.]
METPINKFFHSRLSVIAAIGLGVTMSWFISRFINAAEIKQWLAGISVGFSLLISLLISAYYKSNRSKMPNSRFWKYSIAGFIVFVVTLGAFFMFYSSFEKRMEVNISLGKNNYETRDSVFIKGLYFTKEVKNEIIRIKRNNPGGEINFDVVFGRSNREIDKVWSNTSRTLAQLVILLLFIFLISSFVAATTIAAEILKQNTGILNVKSWQEPSATASQLVFISHSSIDVEVAATIVFQLERSGIPCWIAPRDIPSGLPYAASIIQGIRNSRLMIVVFSQSANKSEAVVNEVEKASSQKLRIIPFKIENEEYSDALEYYLRAKQSVIAYDKSLDEAIEDLIVSTGKSRSNTPV